MDGRPWTAHGRQSMDWQWTPYGCHPLISSIDEDVFALLDKTNTDERVPLQFWLKLLELSVYKQFATPFRIRHRDASNGWIYGCIYHCCEQQAQEQRSQLAVL
jgi:hypothetical protein